ncbi:tetratricopeptide repeat protein [Kaarinaea lacus]
MRPLILFLLFVAPQSYAQYTIDDVPLDLNQENTTCKSSPHEAFKSVQASSFYHQYDLQQYIGEKPRHRLLRSFLCNKKGSSVYYYEYASKAKAVDALNVMVPFIWDRFNLPSQDHPEAIVVIENIIAIISGENIATIEDSLLREAETRKMNPISIGRQMETGQQHLSNQRYQKALNAFKPVAELNHTSAQYFLCEIFIALENSDEAVSWCTKAANGGNSTAQLRLAKMYVTNKWLTPDINAAIALLEKASNQGNTKAASLLNYYYQFKTTDISIGLLKELEDHLQCAHTKDEKHVFACNCLKLFRKGDAIDSDTVDGIRLVGIGVAFNQNDNQSPSFELAGVEFHKNDAVSDKVFRFRATPTEPGEAEMVQNAIKAILKGNVPKDNFAYQFVSTSPLSLEPSLAWKDPTKQSTGSIIDGFRILFRMHKNAIIALEIHPQDPQVVANRFYVMQYKIK